MYILFGIQIILLPFELISYASRRSDTQRSRLLALGIIYALLNFAWLASKSTEAHSYVPHEVISTFGVFAICYTYYYWAMELGMVLERKVLLWLFFLIITVFLALSFVNHFYGGFNVLALMAILIYSELIVLFFIRKIVRHAKSLQFAQLDIRLYAILFAAISSICIPFILLFLSDENLKYISINLGFMAILFAYIYVYVTQMQKEWLEFESIKLIGEIEVKENKKISDTLEKFSSLTAREVEVSKLMIQQLMWKEIADKLNIGESTARKHGANIYAKFGVSKLDEFIEIVSSLSEHSEPL